MNRDLTSIKYDECYLQKHATENKQKFKFLTTNFVDLESAETQMNHFGISRRHGLFTPAAKVQTETSLFHSENTNFREKAQMGQLPLPTLPGKYFQNAFGDAKVEANIRGKYVDRLGRVTEDDAYNRMNVIYPTGVKVPRPIRAVEESIRGGVPTRHLKLK
jgi:hypothetical protein